MTKEQALNALAISDGACNPRGVARTLVESIDEDCKNGSDAPPSPATRLILDQLMWILFQRQIYTSSSNFGDWMDDRQSCRNVVAAASLLQGEAQ